MDEVDEVASKRDGQVRAQFPDVDDALLDDIVNVSSLSDYFFRQLEQDPSMVADLLSSGDLLRAREASEYAAQLEAATIETLDSLLRRTRRREMCRIVFRDLTRRAALEETVRDLSNLADACLAASLSVHYAHNCERYGTPLGEASREAQQMTILALGKLGAQELNLSSDIDLVFFYGEGGMVDGPREMANQDFFIRTARAVIASMSRVDAGGFVFRVDMRLRLYGDSGALILTRPAMEKYFIEEGRDWERYAFIKARACAGDIAQGEAFLEWLAPFVYRKHLDFGAIDSLREMKRLINYEVEVKSLQDDLKLGHGGIREIEFIVQACQIVYGGNETRFRDTRLMPVLGTLEAEGIIPGDDVRALRDAYRFLRNSEHAIQAEADRQTQHLPTSSLSRQRLARAMGFQSFDAYMAALDAHREAVRASFTAFMSSNRADEVVTEANLFWINIWREPMSEESVRLLADHGFDDAAGAAQHLAAFDAELRSRDVQEIGATRLDRLMPVLLSLAARETHPRVTLDRMLAIMSSISRRSTYASYLLENADALKRTVHLCAMSPWVAERLTAFPILLYELSDRVTHDFVFEREKLTAEMRQLMQNLDDNDLEEQMDSLRQFKNGAVLKVAVFELLDLVVLMKASDALTDIAEIVLDKAFDLAWRYLVERHGEPCDADGHPAGKAFAIVAYGKLGGIELGYGSDLDLVFLHDADIFGKTDGERSVDNNVFFSRLGQRIIHILTSYTRFGALYEADLRLRPDGNKGPIVTSFTGYERYLESSAWTWEHQALVRARFVAGNAAYRGRFEDIRARQLARERDRAGLLADVVSMRQKMRDHLDKPEAERADEGNGDVVLVSGFDLKQGAGAMVDIEFMVQYAVLAWSGTYPELTRWTDKMRILDDLARLGVFEEEDARTLQKAYLAYRSAVHYQWLGGELSSFETLHKYRAEVVRIWNRYMASPSNEAPGP